MSGDGFDFATLRASKYARRDPLNRLFAGVPDDAAESDQPSPRESEDAAHGETDAGETSR